jgi:hypothetical protein
MTVKFQYTQEELADATMRLLVRTKTYRRTWRYGLIATFLFGWLLAFAVVSVFFRQPTIGIAMGLVFAVLCGALYPVSQDASVKRRIRSFIKERHAETSSFACQVELTPTQIRTVDANVRRLMNGRRCGRSAMFPMQSKSSWVAEALSSGTEPSSRRKRESSS